jgi:hypothetical protein
MAKYKIDKTAKKKLINSSIFQAILLKSSIFQAILLKSSLFQDILSIMNEYTIILDKDDFEVSRSKKQKYSSLGQ